MIWKGHILLMTIHRHQINITIWRFITGHGRGKHAIDANVHFPPHQELSGSGWSKGTGTAKVHLACASPPLLKFSPSIPPPPIMATPQYAFNEASVQLAGSGIMQGSELQASITRTQNDMNRLHEDVVRTQDGVVLLGEQPPGLPSHPPIESIL